MQDRVAVAHHTLDMAREFTTGGLEVQPPNLPKGKRKYSHMMDVLVAGNTTEEDVRGGLHQAEPVAFVTLITARTSLWSGPASGRG